MMTYAAFTEIVKRDIKDYLPEKYQDAEVDLRRNVKNNGIVRIGITVRPEEQKVTPTVYLEESYKKFNEEGWTMPEILINLARIIEKHQISKEMNFWEGFTTFESAKDKLTFRLINAKANRELLRNCPHRLVEDLAITYQIECGNFEAGKGTIQIDNNVLQMWGDVSLKELDQAAIENAMRLNPPIMQSMEATIKEIMGNKEPIINLFEDEVAFCEQPEDTMYVLSNQERCFGAAVMMYPGIMDKVTDTLGTDCYIIPSSTNEVLIIPKSRNATPTLKELGEVIRDVNATQVEPEEILSDRAYEYNRSDRTLHQIPESAPRQNEKGMAR